MIIDKEKILSFLPHREPFLFVDKVESILLPNGQEVRPLSDKENMVGVEVKALYALRRDHAIFQGHFPSNPILPGVIQVEMMAQAAGFSMFHCSLDATKGDMEMILLSVKNAKFRHPVIPDVDLTIKAKVLKVRGTMVSHASTIHGPRGEVFSEAETLALIKTKG